MNDFVKSLDPLSGPNVMRYVARYFRDNGDGTMTVIRRQPYFASKPPTESPHPSPD